MKLTNMPKYQGLLWKILRKICSFFAWNEKSSMYYKATGSYKGLPRSWEIGTILSDNLSRGGSPFRSIKNALKHRIVIRD